MMKKRAHKVFLLCLLAMAVLAAAAAGVLAILIQNTDIPKLYFEGDIAEMLDKSDVRSIQVTYRDRERAFTGYATLKIQGSSSVVYEKKNYTISLYGDAQHEEKLKVDMGWGAQSKYCLKANWVDDRTQARNVVSARLAHQMQQKYGLLPSAPRSGLIDGFPVEIYANGDFLGLYTFNIPKGDWQFAMDDDNENHILVGGESWEPACLFDAPPSFEAWEVEAGQDSEQTLEKLNQLYLFIRHSSDEAFVADFEKHLDLDAALNYYVFSDLAYLADNWGKNMLMATYDGQKWYPSLYDMDGSWGAHHSGEKLYDYENGTVNLSGSVLFARMEQLFAPQLAQRYFELREDVLSDRNILAAFEAFRSEIPTLTFWKEAQRWATGKIRTPDELRGIDDSQIAAYLACIGPQLDEKYQAMLHGGM